MTVSPSIPIGKPTTPLRSGYDVPQIQLGFVVFGEAGREQKHTLTNLYNTRPTWLELAHKKLDQAVFAAYGWKSDLTDDDILEKLLSLNLERSK